MKSRLLLFTPFRGFRSDTGKVGAFIGVFLFPILMNWRGLLAAESTAAIICILGLIVTLTLLPETKGKSLEEITDAK